MNSIFTSALWKYTYRCRPSWGGVEGRVEALETSVPQSGKLHAHQVRVMSIMLAVQIMSSEHLLGHTWGD